MNGSNGNGNGSPKYFAMLRMEAIEHKIGLENPTNRVYYAILRCSLCYPHQKPIAVRPLVAGSFEKFIEQLHERIKKLRPVREEDIKEERAERDHRGEPVPLSWRDLEAVADVWHSQAVGALVGLRSDGLIADGFPFRPIEVPRVVPAFEPIGFRSLRSDLENPLTSFRINKTLKKLENFLGLEFDCAVAADPAAQEAAAQFLEDVCAVRGKYEKVARDEMRAAIADEGAVVGISIKRASRAKRAGRTDSPHTPLNGAQEQNSAPDPEPAEAQATPGKGLLLAAQTALMGYTEMQLPEIRRVFELLTSAEQAAAIEGILVRVKIGQYDDPRYIPRLLRYLTEKLWTEPLRPRSTGKPTEQEKRAASDEEFHRRLMRDVEETENA